MPLQFISGACYSAQRTYWRLASFGYRQTGSFDNANFLFMPDEEYLSPGDAASTRQIQMTE